MVNLKGQKIGKRKNDKKKRKVDRDPNMPKKPPTAFLIYCNEKRDSIVKSNPSIKKINSLITK